MRQRSRGRQSSGTAEDLLPLEVRRLRCERELSREELARRTGYSRQYIGQLEQPSRGIPARPVIAAVDAALEAGGALVDLREAAMAARADRLSRQPDPEKESRRRIGDLLDHRRSDRELDYLDRLAADLIAAADALDPADVTARVLDQQAFVDQLLRTPMLPHQQFRLFMIAGHLAGLLAISLLDMDELAKASTCCLEAAVFTELTGHEGLRAWTLAINSLIDTAARHAEATGTEDLVGADEGRAEQGLVSLRSAAGRKPNHDERAGQPGAGPRDPDSLDHLLGPAAGHAAFAEDRAVSGNPPPPGGIGHDQSGRRRHSDDGIPSLPVTGLDHPGSGLQPNPDELLIAPGGRATPPRLIALVKGRFARFATANAQRATPPIGISQAFRPPV